MKKLQNVYCTGKSRPGGWTLKSFSLDFLTPIQKNDVCKKILCDSVAAIVNLSSPLEPFKPVMEDHVPSDTVA